MTAVWTLAGLTIREAMRRRLFIAGLLIALLFVMLAFLHIPYPSGLDAAALAGQHDERARVFAWLGCGMIKFFASVLAVTLAAGAITAEAERGLLAVVVPKPLPRAAIYLGKWLGFILLLAACLVLWGVLLALAVRIQTGVYHPRIFLGVLTVGLFPLLFATLTLAFSSVATYALSAGLALIAAGVALAEDTLLLLSRLFNSHTLETMSHVVGYVVPLGRMNHWITRGLGGAGEDLSARTRGFFDPTAVAATQGDLVYVACYIVFFLAAGLLIFQRRDL